MLIVVLLLMSIILLIIVIVVAIARLPRRRQIMPEITLCSVQAGLLNFTSREFDVGPG